MNSNKRHSYLNDIPFNLDTRMDTVNDYDFTRVDALLVETHCQLKNFIEICDNLIQKIGKKISILRYFHFFLYYILGKNTLSGVRENQVLQQLKAFKMAKKAED